MNTPASRRVRLHAQAIAEHRAAAERAGRIDGEDADRRAGAAQFAAQPIDERALAGAGRARDANTKARPVRAKMRPDQRGACRIVVLDQRDGARDGARFSGQHALGERRHGHRVSSCRAMTSRWISLVPSPMVVSFTSRKTFSAG